nr:ankyrin repeat domain-containing protein [uncultured Sphingomonas sp.]
MKRWQLPLIAIGVVWSATAVAQDLGTGSDGEALLKAVESNDGSKLVDLVEAPGSRIVNYRGYSGETALHIATRRRNLLWVRYLLGKGADANIGDRNGDTALIIASRNGFTDAVEFMLSSRANPNATNRMGETALIVAVQQRQAPTVRKLLEGGANPDKADHAGLTSRDYAKRDNRNPEILKIIETVKATPAKSVGPKLN